jgi:hypothetical protein
VSFGLLNPETMKLIQMMGGGMPSSDMNTNVIPSYNSVPQNLGLLFSDPMLLAEYNPPVNDVRLLSDDQLLSQDEMDLTNKEYVDMENEISRRLQRKIEADALNKEKQLELIRQKQVREEMI